MKLSQLFSGDTSHTETVARPQQTPAQAAYMNRQIRSLVPGQTISGEVLSKNGGEVQIKVSEDLILNARVDRNMNIEVGKNMTFEVKNNGSSLTLSPLFTNVSTDMNVLKALDMAGLPVNGTSVRMTEQLMQAGLPVNKNILQQIFREINSFPQNEISDVIALHKLQLPVNESNMEQMAAYRNLNHQLIEGMDTVLEALPEVFDSMVEEGDIPGAMRLYREVLELIRESGGAVLSEEGAASAISETAKQGPGGEQVSGNGEVLGDGKVLVDGRIPEAGKDITEEKNLLAGRAVEGLEELTDLFSTDETGKAVLDKGNINAGEEVLLEGGISREGSFAQESLSASDRPVLAEQVLELLDHLRLPEQTEKLLRTQLTEFARGQGGVQEFFSALGMAADYAKTSEGAMQMLERVFSGKDFKGLLTGQLKKFWTLTAEDVAVPGKVEEMYRRLDRQLRGLSQALENAGQTNSTAFKAASVMSHNVDFLQQINQMYTYVQLPLRLQQGDAHGELYVYTNKKKLSSKEGTISALLHLDMENLGPVDVYVSMQSSKVNTKFYVRDEEMIDFLGAHMDILTQRLQKRGYDCSFSMTTRKPGSGEATDGGLAPILGPDKGVMLSQYAFDVRT